MLDLILKFMFFAIIGYIAEVLYVYLLTNKWVNRGFLNGPYIPIYAFGSLFTILFLNKYADNILIIFFMGMIVCSALEYYTSYIMEMIFYRRWWDYSHHKYNLNGRISLKNTILFGIGCIIVIYILSPLITNILNQTNLIIKIIIASIFIIIFIIDLIFSIIDASKTSKNIKIFNKFTKKFNKNQRKTLAKIKIRILKAYPFLTKNNKELIGIVQKLKKEFKKKTKNFKKKKL